MREKRVERKSLLFSFFSFEFHIRVSEERGERERERERVRKKERKESFEESHVRQVLDVRVITFNEY